MRTPDGRQLDGMDAVRYRVDELVATANGQRMQLAAVTAGDPIAEQITATREQLQAALEDTAAYHAGFLDELEKAQAGALAYGPRAEQEALVERERLTDSLLKIRQALAGE